MTLKEKISALHDRIEELEDFLVDCYENMYTEDEVQEIKEDIRKEMLPLWSQWCDQKLEWLQEHWDEFRVEDLEAMMELKKMDLKAF